jgi:hypothetical protein
VELFARDRVVLLPAGIGAAAPRRTLDGRVLSARCYGPLVTLEPTGVVLVRRGAHARLRDLFRAWRQPLSTRRLAGFRAPGRSQVRIYVGGRRRAADPRSVVLRAGAEIVLEAGPYVPPHRSYVFAAP